ncbi:hypothetical protein C1N87_26925 (plasmid) [Priestia aryabhattai]
MITTILNERNYKKRNGRLDFYKETIKKFLKVLNLYYFNYFYIITILEDYALLVIDRGKERLNILLAEKEDTL